MVGAAIPWDDATRGVHVEADDAYYVAEFVVNKPLIFGTELLEGRLLEGPIEPGWVDSDSVPQGDQVEHAIARLI